MNKENIKCAVCLKLIPLLTQGNYRGWCYDCALWCEILQNEDITKACEEIVETCDRMRTPG